MFRALMQKKGVKHEVVRKAAKQSIKEVVINKRMMEAVRAGAPYCIHATNANIFASQFKQRAEQFTKLPEVSKEQSLMSVRTHTGKKLLRWESYILTGPCKKLCCCRIQLRCSKIAGTALFLGYPRPPRPPPVDVCGCVEKGWINACMP